MRNPGKPSAVDNGATKSRPVTAQEFGERMNNYVSAKFYRPQEHGGRHSVIDNEGHPVCVRGCRQSLNVAYVTGGVADALAEDRDRIAIDLHFQVFRSVAFRKTHLHPETRQNMREQSMCRAVELRDRDDIAPDFGQAQQGAMEGGLTRAQAKGSYASFESSYTPL